MIASEGGRRNFYVLCMPASLCGSYDHQVVLISVAVEVVIGVATSAALIIGILIVALIVVLSVITIKGRKPHCHHENQCTCQGTFCQALRSASGFDVL